MPYQWQQMNNGHTQINRGHLVLIASAFAFSLMSVCVKHLGGNLPISEIVFSRSVISLAITRSMLYRAHVSPWGKNKSLLLVRGILGTAALFCVFEALTKLPLAVATILQYTYPTFTAIGAWFLLKEGVGYKIGISVFIGWIGTNLIVNPNWVISSTANLPIKESLIALAGAFLTALAYISIRKLSKHEHPLVIVHYFPFVSALITLPLVLKSGVFPSGEEWIWLIGVGVFTQVGQVWITEGFSQLPAAQASSINYVQVIFAALWGVTIFNERIGLEIGLGAICILVSILINFNVRDYLVKN